VAAPSVVSVDEICRRLASGTVPLGAPVLCASTMAGLVVFAPRSDALPGRR
jgi:hypothetical protein